MKFKKSVLITFVIVIISIVGIYLYNKHQSYDPHTCSYPGQAPKCASGSMGF